MIGAVRLLRLPALALRQSRGADDARRATSASSLMATAFLAHRHADLVVHRQRRRSRTSARCSPCCVLYTIGWLGETISGPGGRRSSATSRSPTTSQELTEGHHRHQGPRLLRHAPDRVAVPDAAIGRVGTLEVGREPLGLPLRPPRPPLPRLRLRRARCSSGPATDPYVLLNLVRGHRSADRLPRLRPRELQRRPRPALHALRRRRSALLAPLRRARHRAQLPGRPAPQAVGRDRGGRLHALTAVARRSSTALQGARSSLTAFVEGGVNPQLETLLDSYRYAAPGAGLVQACSTPTRSRRWSSR